MSLKRIGFYCWAGPGTIRMLNLKYFDPKINTASLMTSYDYDYLKEVKEKFKITDFWATYSWGFSENKEREDYAFLLSRLDNFKKLNIKVHAYIQGANLVYEDFKNKNWWAKDEKDRLITYFRGRKVVCVNNNEFIAYKLKQIKDLYNKGFDGVFMDNTQMGQLAIPGGNDIPFSFTGCNCIFCQKKFRNNYGRKIPTDFEKEKETASLFMDFREKSLLDFMKKSADITHTGKMEFGSNSYDPKYNLINTTGVNIEKLNEVQDYILFENHSFLNQKTNNSYINKLQATLTKPVFVVSYKKGIGLDGNFSQHDMNNLYSEGNLSNFFVCIKGSEYVDRGVWHNLEVTKYKKLSLNKSYTEKQFTQSKNLYRFTKFTLFRLLLKNYYNPLQTLFMENCLFRKIFFYFYHFVISS